jgi:SAM-dependent methyltransferase
MPWNVQVATWTSNNRYPGVFRTLQGRIAQKAGAGLGQGRLKVLSFGCSTGSELSSLRSYFPDALLYGCDVNADALHSAVDALLMDEAVIFKSTPENIKNHGPFDIILAMSVLCRFPESMSRNLLDLSTIYPFEDFNRTIRFLSDNLRTGGILCLYNTNHDFARSDVAAQFRAVRSPLLASNGFVDKFDVKGQRMTWCEQIGPYYVHRIRRSPDFDEQFDFTGCIFEKADHDKSDIFVPIDSPLTNDRFDPPQQYKFGPDLTICAREGFIATALGYWFEEGVDGHQIVRSWHRTTSSGLVKKQPCWTITSDASIRNVLLTEPDAQLSRQRHEIERPHRRRVISSLKSKFRARLNSFWASDF